MKRTILIATILGLAVAALIHSDDTKSVWDGSFTQEQAKRGQPLYNRECAVCHGDTLGGGEMSPPLTGGSFTSNWDGLALGELYERVRKTMPQNKPGKLSREVNADILAYMLSVNGFPAGQTELSTKTEVLMQIRFEATKPERKEKK